MPTRPTPSCPHEHAPGTTACLNCLREERVAAARRARRILIELGIGLALIVIVGVGLTAGTISVVHFARNRTPPPTAARDSSPAPVPPKPVARNAAGSAPNAAPKEAAPGGSPAAALGGSPPAAPGASARSGLPAASAAAVGADTRPPFAPVIPQGRTDLGDSVYADRAGDTVVVNFDVTLLHTRRPAKFEGILRSTLAQVYGDSGRAIARRIPDGIAGDSANLIDALPARGLHVPLSGGWTLSIYPQTRVGYGGLLVFSYQALVTH